MFNHKLFNALHPRKVPPVRRARQHLVVGYYSNGDRWADSYKVATPAEAEAAAREAYPSITVAGVITLNEDRRMEVVA